MEWDGVSNPYLIRALRPETDLYLEALEMFYKKNRTFTLSPLNKFRTDLKLRDPALASVKCRVLDMTTIVTLDKDYGWSARPPYYSWLEVDYSRFRHVKSAEIRIQAEFGYATLCKEHNGNYYSFPEKFEVLVWECIYKMHHLVRLVMLAEDDPYWDDMNPRVNKSNSLLNIKAELQYKDFESWDSKFCSYWIWEAINDISLRHRLRKMHKEFLDHRKVVFKATADRTLLTHGR